MRLLDGLPKAPGGEMNLPAMPLRRIIAEPILQQRRIQRPRAEIIEPESLPRVDDGEFAGQCQDGALGGGVGELGGC